MIRTRSFREHLTGLQLTLAVIILSTVWIFITFNDFLIFRGLNSKVYESLTKVLSHNVSTCLAFKDEEECKRVLSSVAQDENVLQAVIVDTNNKVFATYGQQLLDKLVFESKGFDSQITFDRIVSSYPIRESGLYEGRLYVVASFDLMETFGYRHALVFLAVMAGSLILVWYLSGYLQRRLTGQLKLLLEAMNRIRRDKTYDTRLSNNSNWARVDVREFLELGEGFDSMIEQVDERDRTMKVQNENLEKTVSDKVQELLRSAELASLGEMAGGIAHEINNPLTIISSTNRVMTRLLEKEQFDKSMFLQLLKNVDDTVARIAKIITGLRNISRRSADEDISDCNFNDVFNDVLEVAAAKFKSKGIEVRKSYGPDLAAVTFKANRIQLSQVLVNLLNNAYDAIVERKDDLWIDLKLIKEDKFLLLKLTDCGDGIPLKVREKMFNPFFTTKEIGKGTGIGLAISKSMVEKMGGSFYYDETSVNTCFVIKLAVL